MSPFTVPEEVLLIALDGNTGGGRLRLGVDWAVAGAAIVELVLTHRITIDDNDVVAVLDSTPTGVAHLDATLAAAGAGAKVSKVLRRTRGTVCPLTINALVDRGTVTRRRVLGVLPLHRYPATDHQAQVAIRRRLAETVIGGNTPDERTAALIGVLAAAKLWRKGVPGGDRRQVKRRMTEIAEGHAVPAAVRKALVRTRAAIAAMAANSG
ncbi:GPP34 family phosphoprotein [Kribbella italica]|uniref:Golgi phosphoprotein 3 GPP34 n=1 Tax=Kribbella italica TaxID=1540520 RepID=A0A7W9JEU2_9ACTN|nr:hypothetical protein [Kribbella italica]